MDQQNTPQETEVKKAKPSIKIYKKDSDGKMIKESEIALWLNISKKDGKEYFSGKDNSGNKYVGFKND